ncbi:adhesion G-protein coupled receptor G2-like [Gouania willdenowi]|uniref:adhesion G-protein coupled receptor G2-like n=1 Tax=Gouania willdenowi TaxID=441366 RepID=UPI0010553182|nr:adhesion G-protein coupled receptor G2-like [Gouania willdenowi]
MHQRKWMSWVVLVDLLWTYLSARESPTQISDCFREGSKSLLVTENFYCFLSAEKFLPNGALVGGDCIVFVQGNATKQRILNKWWPQVQEDPPRLYISKLHTNTNSSFFVQLGSNCKDMDDFQDSDSVCSPSHEDDPQDECHVRCVQTKPVCEESVFEKNSCSSMAPHVQDRYIIDIGRPQNITCINCIRPVKHPEEEISLENKLQSEDGGKVDAGKAAQLMSEMSEVAANMSGSSAALYVSEAVRGVLVRKTEAEDVDEVSIAYASSHNGITIIEEKTSLSEFSKSVTVPGEAFQKALLSNLSQAFVAVLRFQNLTQDEFNSTVLDGEVLAVEMGAIIANLTDLIDISVRNVQYDGNLSCRSWDGEGSKPKWIDDGCVTVQVGNNITCRCSHLTFFAILMSPLLNETISSSDLQKLTIITQVGCGLSMFFLSIILFMHCLLRRTIASHTMLILIHLVSAMFLLNLTFLVNNFVAELDNAVGCSVMGALTHYFLLTTFTWFGAQAFHLCLQLYKGGPILIKHYLLKVSLTSWTFPSVGVIILLILQKYGNLLTHTDTYEDVAMCWITDNNVHLIVNIGYYSLIFILTSTAFIVILSWLYCGKRDLKAHESRGGKHMVTVLGLCSMLGITWGFAFFAFGAIRIYACYIFTTLNSFQGLFLFIYYYNIRNGDVSDRTYSSTVTTSVTTFENPYCHSHNQHDEKFKK